MHAPTDRIQRMCSAAQAARTRGAVDHAEQILAAVRDEDARCADAYLELAELAMSRGQYDVAAPLVRRAIAEGTSHGRAWTRLGNALWRGQHYDEARGVLGRAAETSEGDFLVHQNRGLLCYLTGDAAGAVRHLSRALELAPDDKFVKSDYAHAVLKSGDLRRGLRLFEARWEILAKSPAWQCGLPRWRGETGRALLLHAEQGYGDTLQFIRFAPLIKALGGFDRVLFAGPVTLRRLITTCPGVDEYVDIDNPGEILRASRTADFHAPLISAVAELELSYDHLPPAAPYLRAPDGSNVDLHGGGATLAVGLVWAASVGHERSRQRSVRVTDLLCLGEVPGVRLWSLQMAPHAREAVDTGADLMISDATTAVMDFADTAGVVRDLDVVVSVDTAMVHLAGGLGTRCLMLNPHNACWRWARGATPWYGSVELFDQAPDLTWTHAIQSIRARIEELARGRK